MDDELLARLKYAGLVQVAIGAESGSDELLTRITNKTTVEATLEAVRRLTRHGIDQYLFFMVGYPDEPDDALEKTLEFVVQLKKINPRVTLHLNFATPLPGSEVFRVAVDRGLVDPPRSFEDWARFDYLKPNLRDDRGLRAPRQPFQKFLNLAYPQPGAGRRLPSTLRSIAQWRLDRRYSTSHSSSRCSAPSKRRAPWLEGSGRFALRGAVGLRVPPSSAARAKLLLLHKKRRRPAE